jgi:hypothetical protein
MTDAPGPYQQVNVDVMGVEITGDGGQSVTLMCFLVFMIFLNYQMGEKIITTDIRNFKVQQIRLILGTKHSGTRRYNLSIEHSSAEQSGLKLQVNQTLQEGIMYHTS